MISRIVKYLEYSALDLNFLDEVPITELPDNALVTMLGNIQNRLMIITGYNYFVIIHRVSDNFILKY